MTDTTLSEIEAEKNGHSQGRGIVNDQELETPSMTHQKREPTHVTVQSRPFFGRLQLVPPYAHVQSGFVVIHTSFGLTRWHALGRAAKWAQRHGADGSLRVSRWRNPHD